MQEHDLIFKYGKERSGDSGRYMRPKFPQVIRNLSDQRHSDRLPELKRLYVLSNRLALLPWKVLEPFSDWFAA